MLTNETGTRIKYKQLFAITVNLQIAKQIIIFDINNVITNETTAQTIL